MAHNLNGKRISIIGAGVSGCALAKLAARNGAEVFVSDGKEIGKEKKQLFAAEKIAWEENGNSERLLEADEIVVSSGIPPYIDAVKEAKEKGIKLTGELDFVAPFLNGKIIAVTGSNGKTTTTSMLADLLKLSGYKSTAAGNIGLGVADLAEENYEYIAMELSSFQLYWSSNFKCKAGIITNLAPDHLNWHGSYENYVASKANLFNCVQSDGVAICQQADITALRTPERTNVYELAWSDTGRIFMDEKTEAAYLDGEKLFDFSEIKLLGKHNLENTAMALAALKLSGAKIENKLLAEFEAPRHRCEFVGRVNGITFVNDSKGTNVAASITAMSSLSGDKIVILGGQGKGEDYAPLAEAVKKYAKHIVLLGSEKEKIANAIKASDYADFEFAESMKEAVEKSYASAKTGDTILLSPACTSWDMYPNFETRGDDFCAIAAEIINRE